ncbi:MAG: UDP-N-acetylmuramate dehydrogenase [Lachnospiraceae bacterium]|jgi:UDP-N-acetylmuramate dehydrogenase
MNNEVLQELKNILGEENILFNEPMSRHLSMEVGGPADYFATPENAEAIARVVKLLNEKGIPYYVIGNGTNVIVKDEGFRGVIVSILEKQARISIEDNVITAEAGAMLKDLADAACEASLTGLEFASGIPGSLGGAIIMNAGAYDGEMKDVVCSVTAVDRTGKIVTFSGEKAEFSYRHSIFSDGDYVVTKAVLELKKGDKPVIRARMDDLNKRRADKQPLEHPSCGSTFKRPEGYYVGQLVMDCGLAGARIGGVSVSTKHCGFIVNDKGGTSSEVIELIEHVRSVVNEKYGILLECEVKVL